MIRKTLLVLAFIAFPAAAQEVLDNAAVIRLVRSGLSTDVIVLKIERTNAAFDTSTNALVDLKGANVPDGVVKAMLLKEPAQPRASAPAAPASPDELCVTLDYYTLGTNGWGWVPANVCASKAQLTIDEEVVPVDRIAVHCLEQERRLSFAGVTGRADPMWRYDDAKESYEFRGEQTKALYDFLARIRSDVHHGECSAREVRALLHPSPARN